jgi:hypothetical protein
MVRTCNKYDPAKHLVKLTDQNGKSSLYLKVSERVEWFNVWCDEAGLHLGDYTIDNSEVFIEGNKTKCKAYIKVRDVLVSAAIGSCPSDNPKADELASTAALGRALANIGFGTTLDGGDAMLQEVPCDAGISVDAFTPIDLNAIEDMPFSFGDESKPKSKPVDVVQPVFKEEPVKDEPKDEEPEVEIIIPTTRDEALAWEIPTGPHKGKKLGIVMAQKPASVKYAANKMIPRNKAEEAFQAAAKLVLETQ